MGSPKAPKAPPPPPPPPTKTSGDVAQAEAVQRKRLLKKGGRQSTILNQQVNQAQGKDKLGV